MNITIKLKLEINRFFNNLRYRNKRQYANKDKIMRRYVKKIINT